MASPSGMDSKGRGRKFTNQGQSFNRTPANNETTSLTLRIESDFSISNCG